ncbi:MAG: DUF362 domain-containing protein, partial [Candidatus Rifleibacteriota bacterium]
AGAVAARTGLAKVLPAQEPVSVKPASGPDLVAVRGGEPAQMFDLAIAAMGGIEQFGKAGNKVVVKPNIGWARTPAEAANTNPDLIGHIVKLCLKAGAKEVKVFDNTCNEWQQCYQLSGIEKAVIEAGGVLIPANSESYYTEIGLPNGKQLKQAMVHKAWLEADAVINVPILKDHGSARMTSVMKNLMGIVWDRRYYHRTDLHQCIADFATFDKKPVLNVVDAYNIMMQNGPRGTGLADVAQKKALIMSRDMVAADAAAAAILGVDVTDIPYIAMANELGVGENDLKKLKIERLSV